MSESHGQWKVASIPTEKGEIVVRVRLRESTSQIIEGLNQLVQLKVSIPESSEIELMEEFIARVERLEDTFPEWVITSDRCVLCSVATSQTSRSWSFYTSDSSVATQLTEIIRHSDVELTVSCKSTDDAKHESYEKLLVLMESFDG